MSPNPPDHTQQYQLSNLGTSLKTWVKMMALVRRLATHEGASIYGVQMDSIP